MCFFLIAAPKCGKKVTAPEHCKSQMCLLFVWQPHCTHLIAYISYILCNLHPYTITDLLPHNLPDLLLLFLRSAENDWNVYAFTLKFISTELIFSTYSCTYPRHFSAFHPSIKTMKHNCSVFIMQPKQQIREKSSLNFFHRVAYCSTNCSAKNNRLC